MKEMKASFYRLTCLTNLHVGSGETNYNIVDLEVERDAVLGEPTINASGVKGALRDACEEWAGTDEEKIKMITHAFGSRNSGEIKGSYKFFSGDLLARPVRVSGGSSSYVLATTPDLINHFVRKLQALGLGAEYTEIASVQARQVFTGAGCNEIEGYAAAKREGAEYQKENAVIEQLIGANWALMNAETLRGVDLPVMAHNVISDGKSDNFWYEEVVPHESIFGLLIIADTEDSLIDQMLADRKVVQFGAGASTGNGFMTMEKAGVNA